MPRWSYDFGELIATGIDVDPEQERITSEGGHLLTLWPLLDWLDKYPRGSVEHLIDQDGNSVMVPIIYKAVPWSDEQIAALRQNYSNPAMFKALTAWPSYIGEYQEPDFISFWMDLPVDEHVLRIWDAMPVDEFDPMLRDLQLGFSRMFDELGVTEMMAYLYALGGEEWVPTLPGYPDEEIPEYWDAEETAMNQENFDNLLKRGLVTDEGQIMPLPTAPIEKYLEDPAVGDAWHYLLGASLENHKRAMRVMSQDNHPLYLYEELFSPWE